ncbi:MAG: DUF2489 domain-containing protein [Oleibacter sp.]|nr:DUF2489 domain-containing protein [Thalassolituus sp.]
MSFTLLVIIGLVIVVVLGVYAWRLTQQVKTLEENKRAEQAEAEMQLRRHQQELINDVRFISRAVATDQCDITEGVMRAHYLLSGLDTSVWGLSELSSVREHFEATRDMPILDAYKALSRQQQFDLDLKRVELEDMNKAAIKREFNWLASYSFPEVTLLQ